MSETFISLGYKSAADVELRRPYWFRKVGKWKYFCTSTHVGAKENIWQKGIPTYV